LLCILPGIILNGTNQLTSDIHTMNAATGIAPGQRYRDAAMTAFGTPSRTVWVVDDLWQESDGLAYVRLVNEASPTRTKTLSLAVFANQRLYVRITDRSDGQGRPRPATPGQWVTTPPVPPTP